MDKSARLRVLWLVLLLVVLMISAWLVVTTEKSAVVNPFKHSHGGSEHTHDPKELASHGKIDMTKIQNDVSPKEPTEDAVRPAQP